MKKLFHAVIPVDRHIVKKNSRPIWRGRLGKSMALRNAENTLTLAIIQEMKSIDNNQMNYPITTDVSAKITFYFPTKRFFTKEGKRNKKLPDISNLYELVQDCLQKAGVLFDDNQIDNHDGSRRKPWPSERYAVAIELFEI